MHNKFKNLEMLNTQNNINVNSVLKGIYYILNTNSILNVKMGLKNNIEYFRQ